MFAIVSIKSFKVNLIVTEHSNIDWITKEIEDKEDLFEFEFSANSIVDVFDIKINKHKQINVVDIDETKHRLLIDKRTYVILHKLNV